MDAAEQQRRCLDYSFFDNTGALGSFSWHSGMVRPRKRMPSTGSSSDVSYTIDLTERMPP